MAESDGIEIDRLLATGEVAERLHLSKRAVLRAVKTGTIPIVGTFGVQEQLVYREEDIERLAGESDHQ